MSNNRESIDNRERILVAAEELFAQQGFAATSVREIVQRAEVTAPVLYYYFGSKDDLLRIMIEQRFEEFLKRCSDAMDSAESLTDVIGAWCDSLAYESADHPTTFRLILSSVWGQPVPHVRALIFKHHMAISEKFVECVQRFLPDVDYFRVRFAMSSLHGLLNSFIFPMLHGCELGDFGDIKKAIVPRIELMLTDDLHVPAASMAALEKFAHDVLLEDGPEPVKTP